MRDSFIFYKSFYESIKELEPLDQVQIYNAIFEYEFNKNDIKLNGVSKSIFTLIKPLLIANDKKYENGKKGGRPATKEKPNSNQSKTKTKPNSNLMNNDKCIMNNDKCIMNNDDDDDIYTFTQQQFGRPLSSPEIDLLLTWEDNELTRYAIKQTVLARKNSLKYTHAILNSYKAKGITNVLDAEKEKEDFEKKKQEPKKEEKNKSVAPEWLNKDYSEKKERTLTKEDYETIRRIKETDRIEKTNKDNNV